MALRLRNGEISVNDVKIAFKAAGVKVPSLKQRIWNFVKEHPQATAGRIAEEMLSEVSPIQKTCCVMSIAGSLTKQLLKVGRRSYLHYTAVGATYCSVRPVQISCLSIKPDEKQAVSDIGVGGWDASMFCANLTLGELLALRSYLSRVLK